MTLKQAEFFPIYSGEIVSITPQISQSLSTKCLHVVFVCVYTVMLFVDRKCGG